MQWELVENTDNGDMTICDRLWIPQGWLVRTTLRGASGERVRCSQLLIEDQDHSWQLASDKEDWKGIEESRYDDFVVSEYLKVPGGWVVRTITVSKDENGSGDVQQTFIADPEHIWI